MLNHEHIEHSAQPKLFQHIPNILLRNTFNEKGIVLKGLQCLVLLQAFDYPVDFVYTPHKKSTWTCFC